jgi:hypothetical protein
MGGKPTKPWDSEGSGIDPMYVCGGFKLVAGNVVISFTYVVYWEAVLLGVHIQIGSGPPEMWRKVWAPWGNAVRTAETLVEDAEDYLMGDLKLRPRSVEDLNTDDFLEHLSLRLQSRLN